VFQTNALLRCFSAKATPCDLDAKADEPKFVLVSTQIENATPGGLPSAEVHVEPGTTFQCQFWCQLTWLVVAESGSIGPSRGLEKTGNIVDLQELTTSGVSVQYSGNSF
jgi:hypothetical protein